jgi:hypothetical protein
MLAGSEAEFRPVPITGAKAVKSVVEKFREARGEGCEDVLREVGRGRSDPQLRAQKSLFCGVFETKRGHNSGHVRPPG